MREIALWMGIAACAALGGCGDNGKSEGKPDATQAASSSSAKASDSSAKSGSSAGPTGRAPGAKSDEKSAKAEPKAKETTQKENITQEAVDGLHSVLLSAPSVDVKAEDTEKKDSVLVDLSAPPTKDEKQEGGEKSGKKEGGGWGDDVEGEEAGTKAEALATFQEFNSAQESVSSGDPDKSSKGFVTFRKVGSRWGEDVIIVGTDGLKISGEGNWGVVVFAFQNGEKVTESQPKRVSVRGRRGTTGAVEFSLNPNSGGLEKLKGEVLFSLVAFRETEGGVEAVNSLPVLVAEMRYGKVVDAGPTYASLVNGRVFRSRGVFQNGTPAVTAVEFAYDSQKDCLFTTYADFEVHGNRVDEGVSYEGCAHFSRGEFSFDVDAICKLALNNEPQCKKHEETATSKFVLYPYGIGIMGRIFREPEND